MKRKGFFAGIMSLIAMIGMHTKHHGDRTGNASHTGRMDLSRLPPAWKGRRMARIMRGGK